MRCCLLVCVCRTRALISVHFERNLISVSVSARLCLCALCEQATQTDRQTRRPSECAQTALTVQAHKATWPRARARRQVAAGRAKSKARARARTCKNAKIEGESARVAGWLADCERALGRDDASGRMRIALRACVSRSTCIAQPIAMLSRGKQTHSIGLCKCELRYSVARATADCPLRPSFRCRDKRTLSQ